jgi:hypothetical protein
MLDEPAKFLIMFDSKSVIQTTKENYVRALSRYRSTEHENARSMALGVNTLIET